MEGVTKNITLETTPIHVLFVAFFKRQTNATFDSIMQLVVNACPELKNCQWAGIDTTRYDQTWYVCTTTYPHADSDGCDRLGGAIEAHLPLADHGIDQRHVLQNIIDHAVHTCKLPRADWRRKVQKDMVGDDITPGVLSARDPTEAATLLTGCLEKYPPAMAQYIATNKTRILMSVLSDAARREKGRVCPAGIPTAPCTQNDESTHAMIRRILNGKPANLVNLLDACGTLFTRQKNEYLDARMGVLSDVRLRPMYNATLDLSHLEEYCRAAGARPVVELLSLRNMAGPNGVAGTAKLNEQNRRAAVEVTGQQQQNDTERQQCARLMEKHPEWVEDLTQFYGGYTTTSEQLDRAQQLVPRVMRNDLLNTFYCPSTSQAGLAYQVTAVDDGFGKLGCACAHAAKKDGILCVHKLATILSACKTQRLSCLVSYNRRATTSSTHFGVNASAALDASIYGRGKSKKQLKANVSRKTGPGINVQRPHSEAVLNTGESGGSSNAGNALDGVTENQARPRSEAVPNTGESGGSSSAGNAHDSVTENKACDTEQHDARGTQSKRKQCDRRVQPGKRAKAKPKKVRRGWFIKEPSNRTDAAKCSNCGANLNRQNCVLRIVHNFPKYDRQGKFEYVTNKSICLLKTPEHGHDGTAADVVEGCMQKYVDSGNACGLLKYDSDDVQGILDQQAQEVRNAISAICTEYGKAR